MADQLNKLALTASNQDDLVLENHDILPLNITQQNIKTSKPKSNKEEMYESSSSSGSPPTGENCSPGSPGFAYMDDEDHNTMGKLVQDIQSLTQSLPPMENKKQLNFRLPQGASDEDGKGGRPGRLSRPKDLGLCRYNRSHTLESPAGDSTRLFLENEKLIESKTLIKWSDVSSTGSPGTPLFSTKSKFANKSTRYPKRAVLKNGECNVLKKTSLSKRRLRYLQDIFTTLVDAKWRWTLLVFALSFIMSWLFYAILFWLIAFTHGDFEHLEDEEWTPCVENLRSFTSSFLFSVETQHTIGYGGRSTNEECPEAIFVMCIQSITGVMISAFMAGIFFAKMSRPKQRRQTLLFSRRAIVCQRDGQLCLMFRVGDMRKSHIIGPNIRAHMFRTRITREGEELPHFQCELSVTADGCDSDVFFLWPLTVVHVIDKDSPLYAISAQELLHETFELVVILEGTVESTGQTTQARSSYIPSEIKWGHRFEPLVSYNEDRQGYEVDYKKFNNMVKVPTPLCSAKDLEEVLFVHSELSYDYRNAASDSGR